LNLVAWRPIKFPTCVLWGARQSDLKFIAACREIRISPDIFNAYLFLCFANVGFNFGFTSGNTGKLGVIVLVRESDSSSRVTWLVNFNLLCGLLLTRILDHIDNGSLGTTTRRKKKVVIWLLLEYFYFRLESHSQFWKTPIRTQYILGVHYRYNPLSIDYLFLFKLAVHASSCFAKFSTRISTNPF
jgi:hypothetical protein